MDKRKEGGQKGWKEGGKEGRGAGGMEGRKGNSTTEKQKNPDINHIMSQASGTERQSHVVTYDAVMDIMWIYIPHDIHHTVGWSIFLQLWSWAGLTLVHNIQHFMSGL